MIFLNFGMGLMSSDDSKLKVQFTDVFKRQVRDLVRVIVLRSITNI